MKPQIPSAPSESSASNLSILITDLIGPLIADSDMKCAVSSVVGIVKYLCVRTFCAVGKINREKNYK